MSDTKRPGKKVQQAKEQELLYMPGSNFQTNLNDLVILLTTKDGRNRLRKILGPSLPSCAEDEWEED